MGIFYFMPYLRTKPSAMILRCLLFIAFLFNILTSFAQENENPCGEISNKKAIKLYEKSIDRKGYDFKERMVFVKEAIELEPEYVDAIYQLASMKITIAKGDNTSFAPAQKDLLKVIELCPDYQPYAYFYLGQVAYGASKYEDAAKYMTLFLKRPENAKNDADYKLASDILKDSKFNAEIYGKPVPFDPQPVPGVCTFEDEYLAMLSPDNDQIYYTHKYSKQGRGELVPRQIEEFTFETREGEKFAGARALDFPFNVGDNYGGVTFSLDNKHMFITVCKPIEIGKMKGKMNCDIYTSDFADNKWSDLRNLGPNVNTEDGWEAQPTLSADSKILYFATARADSKKNSMDIYKTERSSIYAEWGQAVSVGDVINTNGNEKSPFVHSDSQTLYFSSDMHPGVGAYDIFYTKLDTGNQWKDPKNIGVPINTEKDEVGFFVSTDGHKGYFSSNQIKGKGVGGYDVFYFDLYKEARPEKILFAKGVLKDENGAPARAKIELKSVNSKKTVKVDVDTLTGEYAGVIAVMDKEDVILSVEKENYAFTSQYIKTTGEVMKPIQIDFNVKPLEIGSAYTINDINYNTNSADITLESKNVLSSFADYLKKNENIRVEIRGHTDNVGNSNNNLLLSTNRAFTVYDVLMQLGVTKSRIQFKGFGDKKPIADNASDEGKAKNRRTEFVLISK